MYLTTKLLARSLGIQPQSIRARYSKVGVYFGLKPLKCPNGRLLWPADAVERLTGGNAGKDAS